MIRTAIGTLKNNKMQSLSQNSPCLHEDRSSKQNSSVINPLPRSFINEGRPTPITEEKFQKSTPHSSKLSRMITPPIYFSRGPFISPKNHSLSPKTPSFPLPIPTKAVVKPEFETTLGTYSFLLGYLPYIQGVAMIVSFCRFSFLLIFFCHGVSAKNLEE